MQFTGVRLNTESSASTRCSSWRRSRVENFIPMTMASRRPSLNRTALTHHVVANYAHSPIDSSAQRTETVREVMTAGRVHTVTATTSVIDALALIVEKRITGLPVVNEDEKVIGVVSDFDLLSIDLIGEDTPKNIFPPLDQTWEVFKNLQAAIMKSHGRIVEDVMSDEPIVVRPETNIHSAARLLMETKNRRLPVVNEDGILIGMITRRDIITAALRTLRENPEFFASSGLMMA